MEKSNLIVILLACIVISGLCSIPFIVFLNIPLKVGTGSTVISGLGKNMNEIEIINQIPMGEININERSEPSYDAINLEWEVEYQGPYFPQSCILVNYQIINYRLKIFVNMANEIDIQRLTLEMYLSPRYTYSIESNTGNANVNLNAYAAKFKNLYFTSITGDFRFKINNSIVENNINITTNTGEIRLWVDHVRIDGNLYCKSNSGVQLLDFWNVYVNNDAKFNVNANLGYTQLYWANHFNKSQKVNIKAESNSDILVKLWCPIELVRCAISLYTLTGTTRLVPETETFEKISENHYVTHKINDTSLDLYNITILSNYGEARMRYVDCFKWSRICDYTQDFHDYTVSKSGNYSIYRGAYDITTIHFFNTNYIYLNESRTLNINLEILPSSSEKLLFIDWNMEYIHAMGIGVGDIDLEILKTKESDTLSVNLKLEYILDQILPTFIDYNITVYHHPDYTFNNYIIPA